ncbi:tryptophan synthase subunit alpha [Bacillus shivajii]|uniref:tryptophan synthase subunit alpha n=1 Tax=Bacillus shivajii TaxID=1983719 RepID=UPI001CFB0BDA|nr:tryptophan synthase subunit alpha [Bacillus shivajii]UCZ54785.1 tryptophan synthase subunit alpha [Bacillus shivajii]
MNRLVEETFQQKENKFIPYIMAGDPSIEVSIDIALTLEKAGADALEWGVPFSDPLADGPVIQKAGTRARNKGTNIKKAIEGVKEARKQGLTIPVILFTYINPVLSLGEEETLKLMVEADIDGILIPDLPVEESNNIREQCKSSNKTFISLVALNSKERMKEIAKVSDGFLYFVTSYGVTGTRESFSSKIDEAISEVKTLTHIPVIAGFGISQREHVRFFQERCDGVIVGSALVKVIEEREEALQSPFQKENALNQIKAFVQELIS